MIILNIIIFYLFSIHFLAQIGALNSYSLKKIDKIRLFLWLMQIFE
jgi:hypothetical protein